MSDLVEREAVLRTVVEQYSAHNELIPPWLDFTELPSVTHKSGKWIRVTDKTGHLVWECDKCNWQQRFNTNFCPDCGARMEGSEE